MQEHKQILYDFLMAVFLAEMAGPDCHVQLKQTEARKLVDRMFDLEQAFDEMMVCYMEAEDECAKLKAWVYMLNGGHHDNRLPPL